MSSTSDTFASFAAKPSVRRLVDWAMAVGVFAGTLSQLAHGGIGPAEHASGRLDLAGGVLAAASALPLVAWRRSPRTVFAVTAVASVAMAAFGFQIDLALGPAAALYLVVAGRRRESSWPARGTVAMIGGSFVAFLVAAAWAQQTFPIDQLAHTGLAGAVAWFAGERTRLRREHLNGLQQRAERAEREAERERLLAVAEERVRIARDLHDSAANAISVIAVRAGAARLRNREEPDRSRQALAAIEDTARQTVEEIDRIVGALRDENSVGGVVEAPHGVASLETLAAGHRSAGLEVRIETAGTPRTLGRLADQAAYRIVQEALANAARYGTGGARIDVAYGESSVELSVTNPVATSDDAHSADPGTPAEAHSADPGTPAEAHSADPGTPAEAARPSGGHGLIGMRERATMLGGALEATRVDGAFCVRAEIPYGGHNQ